ncbi:MAG TPA: FG-GAP-like repeat-containing protein [Pyrinomonadaceae bacterium]
MFISSRHNRASTRRQLLAVLIAALLLTTAVLKLRSHIEPSVEAAPAISITTLGTPITENFNSLANTGTANTWTDNTTLAGWYAQFSAAGQTANPTIYRADDGSLNTGSIYSYGTVNATERAFGSAASGTPGNIFYAIQLTNNTGQTINSLSISYTGEQWRNGGNTSAQQLDFQYQVASPGTITDANTPTTSWTDFNTLDFVSPTTGATAVALDGNAAANRTAKSGTLTVTVNAGQEIWLRWQDTNDAGNDHGLALDDFSVTANGGGGTPTLSINDVTQLEGNGGATTFAFTVSLSSAAPAGGITFNVDTADGTAQDGTPGGEDNDYIAVHTTGSISAGNTSTTVNVTVNGDTTPEGNETFTVNITNPSAGATLGDGQGLGTITNDDAAAGALRIHDIQGASHISPHNGETVTNVPGIVTALRTNGFYMQDSLPDSDDATSEGIFVFTSSAPAVAVADSLLVSGTVTEFRPGGSGGAPNLTVTEISTPTIVTQSTGNSLPTATVIGTGGRIPPMEVIEDDSTTGDVETNNLFNPANDGIDFHESLEHMRVQVNNAVVVGPTAQFGDGSAGNREVYVIGDNGAHASVRTNRGGIVIRPNDFNPERIVVTNQYQTLGDFNVADTFTSPIVGIYDYNFGKFLLHATSALTTASGGLTQEIANVPGAGQLSIATFNVENLDPNDGAAKFNQLAGLIVNNLRSPDLITLEEMQDNNGATNDAVVDASLTFNTLISAIQSAGGPTYDFRQINPVDDQDGGEPGGNIRVGFLFRTDRGLSFIDRPGGGSSNAVSVVNNGGMPELSFSPGRIDPTNSAFNNSRKPLAGEFSYNGHHLFVIGNHFNSKGGDDPTYGRHQPPVLVSETQRLQQAQIVNNFVDSILAVDSQADIVVLGDLNDFQFSNPMNVLKGGVLHPLVDTLPVPERYTYDFQGNSQALDHITVSTHLFNVIFQYDVVHVNSEFAIQASDHDPQVAYFSFIRKNKGANFDGDAKVDLSVWQPSTGNWNVLKSSDGTSTTQQWGLASLGDVIVPGDYDKDGKTDAAVWRAPTGVWYISRSSDGSVDSPQWGSQSLGDVPVPADYDGDGQTDLAVFRTSNSTWYIQLSSNNSQLVQQFGLSTDKLVPADYDGDGRADIAVWRASTGFWYILNSLDGSLRAQPFGSESLGDVAVPEDYDGDGKADLAVWRAPTGFWYVLRSSDGSNTAQPWGSQGLGDVPVPEDYDGDGKADLAVWREPTGFWYVLRSSDGSFTAQQWGISGDEPLPAAYIQP